MNEAALEGVTLQESQIFHISLVCEFSVPTGVMVAGNGYARSVCVYGNDILPALIEIDEALDRYQEENPAVLMIEFVSDEILDVINLLLESKGLKPIDDDDFNYSDVLFWIDHPTLACQMGLCMP